MLNVTFSLYSHVQMQICEEVLLGCGLMEWSRRGRNVPFGFGITDLDAGGRGV